MPSSFTSAHSSDFVPLPSQSLCGAPDSLVESELFISLSSLLDGMLHILNLMLHPLHLPSHVLSFFCLNSFNSVSPTNVCRWSFDFLTSSYTSLSSCSIGAILFFSSLWHVHWPWCLHCTLSRFHCSAISSSLEPSTSLCNLRFVTFCTSCTLSAPWVTSSYCHLFSNSQTTGPGYELDSLVHHVCGLLGTDFCWWLPQFCCSYFCRKKLALLCIARVATGLKR